MAFAHYAFVSPNKMLYCNAFFFHLNPRSSFFINCNPNETCKWYHNNVNSLMIVIKQKKIILQLYGILYALEFWLKLIIFSKKAIFFVNNNFPGKCSKNASIIGLNE